MEYVLDMGLVILPEDNRLVSIGRIVDSIDVLGADQVVEVFSKLIKLASSFLCLLNLFKINTKFTQRIRRKISN